LKNIREFSAIAAIAIGLTLPIKVVSAQGLPPGQLPELTGEWWQWALSIPASVNPNRVEAGDNTCMIAQRGSIWFLAGVFGGGSAMRTCSVPEGTSLFIPVINFVNVYTPQCQPLTGTTVTELRDYIQPFIKGIHSVSVTLDDQDIKKTLLRFVIADPFEVALPPDNVFGCPVDIYSPAIDEGYYASIPPLSPGAHTLHFHSESDSGPNFFGHVEQDVTYNLTVVPVSLK
jgi:hypothetical protein